MVSITGKLNLAQKKTTSVSGGKIPHTLFNGTEPLEVLKLPSNSLITGAHLIVKTGFDAGVVVDVDVGGTVIFNDIPISTSGTTSHYATPIDTGTGMTVTLTPSGDVTFGEIVLLIEYVEYTLCNGQLTNY